MEIDDHVSIGTPTVVASALALDASKNISLELKSSILHEPFLWRE